MNGRRETMRRLGNTVVDCPACGKAFKLSRETLWFVLLMIDGEVDDDEKNDEPFCSQGCANLRADEMNSKPERAHNELYMPWVNPNWTA